MLNTKPQIKIVYVRNVSWVEYVSFIKNHPVNVDDDSISLIAWPHNQQSSPKDFTYKYALSEGS